MGVVVPSDGRRWTVGIVVPSDGRSWTVGVVVPSDGRSWTVGVVVPSDGRSWTVDVVVLNTWHETGNKYMGFCLSALASQKIHKSYELSNPVFDHQLYLL